MLTKLPDYIISECGYPKWERDRENINFNKIHANLWSTSYIWSTKPSNLEKLLPLRETLTDYYLEKLILKQNESIHNITTKKQHFNKNSSRNSERQSARHVNETIVKNRKQHQLNPHCALDKRRTQANYSDNDLDQF